MNKQVESLEAIVNQFKIDETRMKAAGEDALRGSPVSQGKSKKSGHERSSRASPAGMPS
jgi:hypothetical protein